MTQEIATNDNNTKYNNYLMRVASAIFNAPTLGFLLGLFVASGTSNFEGGAMMTYQILFYYGTMVIFLVLLFIKYKAVHAALALITVGVWIYYKALPVTAYMNFF
ncbi:MAG: hypothetical protein ABFQ64_09400 [Campylobacterota bacterium]